jgi:hypothetical protein
MSHSTALNARSIIAMAGAALLFTTAANAQSAPAHTPVTAAHRALLTTLNGQDNASLFRSIAVDFVQDFVKRHFESREGEAVTWTKADTQKAVDLYFNPVSAELDRRITQVFADGAPLASVERLQTLSSDAATRATMLCAFRIPSPQRTAKVWSDCEKKEGAQVSPADRALSEPVQAALEAAIIQPAVNGAVGGTICHALARFAQHLSKDGSTYTFGTSFALSGGEEPKRCDVHKPRWAAMAGFDALLRVEPQIVFEKKED